MSAITNDAKCPVCKVKLNFRDFEEWNLLTCEMFRFFLCQYI